MYQITKLKNGHWFVECMIQDGWERWHEVSYKGAVHSLIQAARVLNGTYIREDDIVCVTETELSSPPQPDIMVTEEEAQLLCDIRRGVKKILNFDHCLLKYRITEDEAKMLVEIREGRLHTVSA